VSESVSQSVSPSGRRASFGTQGHMFIGRLVLSVVGRPPWWGTYLSFNGSQPLSTSDVYCLFFFFCLFLSLSCKVYIHIYKIYMPEQSSGLCAVDYS